MNAREQLWSYCNSGNSGILVLNWGILCLDRQHFWTKVSLLSTHESMAIPIYLRYLDVWNTCLSYIAFGFEILIMQHLSFDHQKSVDVLYQLWLLEVQIIERAKWIRNKAIVLTHFSSRYDIEVITAKSCLLDPIFLFIFIFIFLRIFISCVCLVDRFM